ncbi:MAG: DUF1493 family protein [Bacteroidota bacterium]
MATTFETLEDFIRVELLYKKPLSRKTRLAEDLGLAGDDGVEFIEKFSEKFEVDFPDDFDYLKYFGPEGIDLIGAIKSAFIKKELRETTIPITLGQLEEAMVKKEWPYS